jgi:hypothetical protein
MKTFELIIVFIVGLVAGCGLTAYFAYKWVDTYMTNTSFVGIHDRYVVLQALQAGDTTNAIKHLETQMNGEVLVFAGMKAKVPIAQLEPSDVRLITQMRDYRAIHPHADDPEIDQTVASILSMTNATLWPDVESTSTATAVTVSTNK